MQLQVLSNVTILQPRTLRDVGSMHRSGRNNDLLGLDVDPASSPIPSQSTIAITRSPGSNDSDGFLVSSTLVLFKLDLPNIESFQKCCSIPGGIWQKGNDW